MTQANFARLLVLGLVAVVLAAPAQAQWVEFQDQTSSRLSATSDRGEDDVEEKDYSVGDVDKDGDLDLAVARKQPFTSPGKRTNVLFMNEGGVLVDRTTMFATDSDVSGDQGFMQLTNNRDVLLVDVDLDGWLDMVTAATISPGDPKHIGYPRVYRNKGCAGGTCNGTNWLGFRFENARIPVMAIDSGAVTSANPCFCDVQAGDTTGDGYPELWFVSYDSGCNEDFNNKLLINKGAVQPGFFTDGTDPMLENFANATFGASGGVADFNDDGLLDILEQHQSFVGIAFNRATNPFQQTTSPYGGSAYFVSYGNLNNDDLPDLAVSDDGSDRYVLNQGPDVAGGVSDFLSFTYQFLHQGAGGKATDDGFGGDNLIADLDKDGWDDVLITDVDVDASGCGRRMHIYKNLGGEVGGNITLQEQTTGSNCQFGNNASCIVASIPANKLQGVHDVAVFDINGDGFKDMVVGRCSGTEVYINQPPGPPAGGTPDGDQIAGSQLLLDKGGIGFGNEISLTWGDSCTLTDTDYEIYEGVIEGTFTSHEPVTCTTGGAQTETLFSGSGNRYYLVVPHNGVFEGSYGTNSNGGQRPVAAHACRGQSVGPCDE